MKEWRRRPAAGPLIDAKAAGELLGVPHTWLLRQARADAVPHIRLGHYVRFEPRAARVGPEPVARPEISSDAETTAAPARRHRPGARHRAPRRADARQTYPPPGLRVGLPHDRDGALGTAAGSRLRVGGRKVKRKPRPGPRARRPATGSPGRRPRPGCAS